MKKINYLILLLVVIVGVSCEPTYVKEYSWAYPVAGDWTLRPYVAGVEVAGGPFEFKTYNSAFGKDSVWLDDYATTSSNGHFWSFKIKVAVDMTTKTFSTQGSKNTITGYPINIIVTNGKIVNNDSITMDVEFGDDPGNIYQLAGHRTTSYEEYMQ